MKPREPLRYPSVREFGLSCCLCLQLAVLGYLQHLLWVDGEGVHQLNRVVDQVEQQTQHNDQLALRNKLLKDQILALKEPGPALEGRARLDLGMIRADETFFLIPR